MHCQEIYVALADQFPHLSADEVGAPYRNSLSHWANRVQFARLHLIEKGWLHPLPESGRRGYWRITDEGRNALADTDVLGEKLLAELDAL